jgi:hypothetical protein
MRLLIGILNCHRAVYPEVLSRAEPPNNSLCADVARKTWIREAAEAGIDVKFFFGRGGTREPLADEVFLNVDDSYEGLIDKVSEMCKWAWVNGYDYFMKVDVDSYVHVKNLLASEFRDWDYTGRGWGLGYILSRTAMKVVSQTTQRLSWAEDSHVLRALFLWGNKSPKNVIRLYGDGRYVFLQNLTPDDVALYDTKFIVANPVPPRSMRILNEVHSLAALLPFEIVAEDLWTAGEERIPHSKVYGAFFIRGEKCPISYVEWEKLTPYNRQPYKDWAEVVHACMETDQIQSCFTFTEWMGEIADRKIIQEWARKVNEDAAALITGLSDRFAVQTDLPAPPETPEQAAIKAKTLIAVISCRKNRWRLKKQQQSWIPQAIAAGWKVGIFDGDALGVPDDYVSLPLKTKALCKWALDHGYKHLLKIDDDDEVRVVNLRAVANDYAGILMQKNDFGLPEMDIPDLPKGTTKFNYASGGGYWLSERAMKIIAESSLGDWAEDRWVGQMLGAAGILPVSLPQYYIMRDKGASCISRQKADKSKSLVVLTQVYGGGH